ncbi:MAG TPA: ornithine cyclodeaminase family protein [Vicinamibacteria bacterium]|nr:ornithine cyclodeaminase family protein [Vicinamibacteria bacterium]
MQVLIVNQAEVRRLLPMAECLDVMEAALAALARGQAQLPLRQVLMLPGGQAAFAAMPAHLSSPAAIGIKVITVFPANHGTEYDSHQGAVLLFETERGRLLAVMDASSITAIRTAAVSGVATRALARPEASVLALLGSGVQAATHLDAALLVRPLRRVRVWSRDPAHVARFVEAARRRHRLDIQPAASAREAVEDADVVCTVTSSREPVLEGAWLRPGTHVNAVGASVRTARELDSAAVAAARVFVDRRESAANEAGDLLIPRAEGAIGDDHVQGELGEVLIGKVAGRRTDAEITVFKSLGLAVEDVASAHHIHARARAAGAGTWVELGGGRDASG